MVIAEAVRDHPAVQDACPAAGWLPVQATADQHRALVAQATDSIAAAVAVTDRQVGSGGRQVRLVTTDGAVVRVVASAPADPRAHPPDTVLVCTFVDDPGELTADQLRQVVTAGGRVAFTSVETGLLREQMPLTAGMPYHLPAGCLTGVAPVLTVHHMTDFLVMVEAVQAMGVLPELITVIDKGYRYRHTHRVDAHLRGQGIAVYDWTRAAEALDDHAARARATGRVGLLVDDGGYTLPVLLDQRRALADEFAGLVEQTMSGIAKLARYGQRLPLPIFSVAESRLKATIESYGVADAAVRNLLALLPQEKFEGQPALVIGFGRIGEQVAETLRARRMRVAVHDTAIVRLVAAHERGFLTDQSLHRLLGHHAPLLVVGTTGATCLRGEDAAAVRRDCYLVSVTSRNREFALDELTAGAATIGDAGQLGTRFQLEHGPTLTVVADGYPINFHHTESLPNKYADLVLAALLVGAATLATGGHGFQPGHNVAATDRVLETSGLLERYYQRFGPHHATGGPT